MSSGLKSWSRAQSYQTVCWNMGFLILTASLKLVQIVSCPLWKYPLGLAIPRRSHNGIRKRRYCSNLGTTLWTCTQCVFDGCAGLSLMSIFYQRLGIISAGVSVISGSTAQCHLQLILYCKNLLWTMRLQGDRNRTWRVY